MRRAETRTIRELVADGEWPDGSQAIRWTCPDCGDWSATVMHYLLPSQSEAFTLAFFEAKHRRDGCSQGQAQAAIPGENWNPEIDDESRRLAEIALLGETDYWAAYHKMMEGA